MPNHDSNSPGNSSDRFQNLSLEDSIVFFRNGLATYHNGRHETAVQDFFKAASLFRIIVSCEVIVFAFIILHFYHFET